MLSSWTFTTSLFLELVAGFVSYPPPNCDVKPHFAKYDKKWHCHDRGTFRYGESTSSSYGPQQLVDSFESCRNLCLRDPSRYYTVSPGQGGCYGFAWNQQNNTCTLLDYQVDQYNFNASETGPLIFTGRKCYECDLRCPQPTGDNLLSNAGFEDSEFLGPWYNNIQYFKNDIASAGHASNRSYHAHIEGYDARNEDLTQDYNLCSGQLYKIQFDYKTLSNTSANPHLNFYSYPFQYNMAPPMALTNGSWATFTSYAGGGKYNGVKGPSVMNVNYGKTQNTNGSIDLYLDNFKFEPVGKQLTSLPGSPEYFQNGGYEDALKNWTPTEIPFRTLCRLKIVSPGLAGNLAVKFTTNQNPSCAIGMKQSLHGLEPKTYYLFSFDYSANSVNATFSLVQFKELGPDAKPHSFAGSILGSYEGFYTMCPDKAPCKDTFTIPVFVRPNAVDFSVQFGLQNTDQVTIDNFSFKKLDG